MVSSDGQQYQNTSGILSHSYRTNSFSGSNGPKQLPPTTAGVCITNCGQRPSYSPAQTAKPPYHILKTSISKSTEPLFTLAKLQSRHTTYYNMSYKIPFPLHTCTNICRIRELVHRCTFITKFGMMTHGADGSTVRIPCQLGTVSVGLPDLAAHSMECM